MAFRSSDQVSRGTDGTISWSLAGLAANDYIGVMTCSDANPAPTIDVLSSGLTSRIGPTQQLTPDYQNSRYYDKIATGSDSLSISLTGGGEHGIVSCCFSGRNTTAPRTFTNTTLDENSNGSPTTANMNGGTAAAGDDVLVVWALDFNATGWTADAGSYDTGWTEREDGCAPSVNFIWMGAFTYDSIGSGATGTIPVTFTRTAGSAPFGWTSYTIAIAAGALSPTTGSLTLTGQIPDVDSWNEPTNGPALVGAVSNLRW